MSLGLNCSRCALWVKPEPTNEKDTRKHLGRCMRDRKPAHATYYCTGFRDASVTHASLGILPAEVTWMRTHMRHPSVRAIAEIYRQIQSDPDTEIFRERFAEKLDTWRRERQQIAAKLRLSVTDG